MIFKSFAKINLGLRILRKREDNYHDLDTIFAQIDLHDDMEFKLREDEKIVIKVIGAKIPQKENLVWQTATCLQKFCNKKFGVDITLKKRIPMGAGLGGGSSNAATTLRALNKLWNLKLSQQKLEELALSLGSDVPFFLHGNVMRGTGRGEILENIALLKNFPKQVILAVPNFSISTKKAFELYSSSSQTNSSTPCLKEKIKLTQFKCNIITTPSISSFQFPISNSYLKNDFEKIIFREYPELTQLKTELFNSGAKFASLSGSGSAVFGLFDEEHQIAMTNK
jgi:4-diphosphocytidyl-2-C-methyl-D-erythritol kinase